jgi:hypothetical protein
MALIAGVGLFFVSVLVAALSRILAADIEAWILWVIRRLIRIAAGWLPENGRGRYKEEWEGYVDEVPGVVGKMLAAAGFLLAAPRMALTMRKSDEASSWLQTLAQIEAANAQIVKVVNAIRTDRSLDANGDLQSLANELSHRSVTSKEELRQAAAIFSAYTAPSTIGSKISGLFLVRKKRTLRKLFCQLSVEAKKSVALSSQLITLLEERRELSARRSSFSP